MKKLFSALVAVGAMALMAVGVQAATYSAGVTSPEAGVAVVPVMVSTADGESTSVNGYVMNLTYDSTKVTPIVTGVDATGEDTFAEVGEEFADGVIVSGIKDTDTNEKTLIVAWAGADAITVDTEAQLASVEFRVDDSATGIVPIEVEVMALTNDGEHSVDTASLDVADGEIVIDAEQILYGDVDGDANITETDASLIAQHAAQLVTLDTTYLVAADVDGDGNITETDASLVAQRAAQLISQFPVEIAN